jgi:hypothetical protein
MIPPSHRAIISIGVNGNYASGVSRLSLELDRVDYRGMKMLWRHTLPAGCPPHQQLPYAFKTYAVDQAATIIQANKDVAPAGVIWLDSSVWPGRSLEPVFRELERTGVYLVQESGCMGHWTSDRALKVFGWTREQAMAEPIVAGGIWGVNPSHPSGNAFLKGMCEMMQNPEVVCGPWRKAQGFVSDDERVQGHRHDMPAMTVLAKRLGLKPLPPNTFLYGSTYPTPQDDIRQWHIRGI